ncbi:nitroreductase family protein [Brevibacillus humidisoli]|uniref:nitroreductase family protein n=1 Tax=Brevibacillus humidisoli TaxID=2895522 RepID=UPI001E383D6E|nr:nitroreductase family protein [Brevibacillus humidisoli]UFJ39961.1 nitroreductase family protein [Brevibacillus humidisoli]
MKETLQQDFFTIIQDRGAVKQFDSSVKMTQAEIAKLIEYASTAPSSWNLQHWKFLVIHDDEAKKKLLPIAYRQQQVIDASATIAVLGDFEANKNAEAVYGPAVAAGAMTEEVKERLLANIEQTYATVPHAPRDEAIRNASLAAMQLMLAAKAMGYDTCPMGGFDAQQLVSVFGIPQRYLPILLIAVGKAAQPARPSSRFPADQIIVWNQF